MVEAGLEEEDEGLLLCTFFAFVFSSASSSFRFGAVAEEEEGDGEDVEGGVEEAVFGLATTFTCNILFAGCFALAETTTTGGGIAAASSALTTR